MKNSEEDFINFFRKSNQKRRNKKWVSKKDIDKLAKKYDFRVDRFDDVFLNVWDITFNKNNASFKVKDENEIKNIMNNLYRIK